MTMYYVGCNARWSPILTFWGIDNVARLINQSSKSDFSSLTRGKENIIDSSSSSLEPCFAVGMLCMSHFKFINDTYGHGSRDKLLIEAARRLEASLWQEDAVSGLGRDKFIMGWCWYYCRMWYIYIYSGFNGKPEACRGDFGPGFWSTVLLGRWSFFWIISRGARVLRFICIMGWA